MIWDQDQVGELVREQDRSPIFQDRIRELGNFQDRVGEVVW